MTFPTRLYDRSLDDYLHYAEQSIPIRVPHFLSLTPAFKQPGVGLTPLPDKEYKPARVRSEKTELVARSGQVIGHIGDPASVEAR